MTTTIRRHIDIHAPLDKVWRVYTEPQITRQMGGEYATGWNVGDTFSWKGTDGKIYASGNILEIAPGKLLKHTWLDMKDKSKVVATLTYRFEEKDGVTTIYGEEEVNAVLTETQVEDAGDGWDFALQMVKGIAEKL